jgi:hypothetical protein
MALLASLGGATGCGGTTGRQDVPAVTMVTPDATVGDLFDLDGGPFDVGIQYVDRVLPEVGPPPSADGGDSGPANAWPCPADLCSLGDDAGFGPVEADGGCPGGFIAAAFDMDGGVIPSPPDSICASCAPFNGGAGCTPTEQLFVLHDPIPPADGGMTCYQCLVNGGALDDTVYPDTNHECQDSFPPSPEEMDAAIQQTFCFNTLECILGSVPNGPTCVSPVVGVGVADCFCGAGIDTITCTGAMFQPSGACVGPEATGLGLPKTPTVPVLNMFTNLSWGSGMANQILVTAAQNQCTRCYQ